MSRALCSCSSLWHRSPHAPFRRTQVAAHSAESTAVKRTSWTRRVAPKRSQALLSRRCGHTRLDYNTPPKASYLSNRLITHQQPISPLHDEKYTDPLLRQLNLVALSETLAFAPQRFHVLIH